MSRTRTRAGSRRRRAAYRRNNQNKFSMFLVTLVVLILMAVASIGGLQTKQKVEENKAQIARLEEQIAREVARSEEIEQERKYRQTKGFYEEVAKDRLGMVYEDEILFKQDNQ